jgi:hypothetical protein
MKQDWKTILLGGMFAAFVAACSSTASHTDNTGSAASGSSGASGSTASSGDADTHGNNTRLTPPPVASPSSTGTVIDDRINNNTDVPGQSH